MNIIELVTTLTSLGPQALALVGAVMTLATGVHVAALAVGKLWAPALKVAEVSGVVAFDAQQIGQWLAKLSAGSGKGPGAGSAIGLVFLVIFTGCATFGQLTPGAKTATKGISQVAHMLCMMAQAERAGISPAQVAEALCDTEEKVHPWIAPALGAQRAGAIQAGLVRDGGAP